MNTFYCAHSTGTWYMAQGRVEGTDILAFSVIFLYDFFTIIAFKRRARHRKNC